ncbi:hypothetical protein JOC86_003619 [Bacillus pakistanensis]|uniref:Uncharacterized protein n=1 Tax=Rossellomorea pakistanensis TaxID=992288 RepID=A0ABS2NGV4_9BACI|nr:hypothetical protein [Bacillus pakistanensis]MBM7587067.1 hypothetical protein [Bacillus pakistanensis]
MDGYLNNFVETAKSAYYQANTYVREKLFAITGTPSATVNQLATFIKTHPNTEKNNKELLGLTFSHYHLESDHIHYYLETKGQHILELDVYTDDHKVVSYRGYHDQQTIDTPLKFPQKLH